MATTGPPTLRAIETHYNGYHFRSRLEARWAVFFDTLGIRYDYEPQGYDLGDGTFYLPDFWLPEQKCWVEIKPDYPPPAVLQKLNRLCQASGYEVALLVGSDFAPLKFLYMGGTTGTRAYLFIREYDDDNEEFCLTDWVICSLCDTSIRTYVGLSGTSHIRRHCTNEHSSSDEGSTTPYSPVLLSAYRAARAARFEHGESGVSR